MKFINETITFLFELLLLVAVWLAGFQFIENTFLAIVVSLACDAVIIVIWSLFLAPRAKSRVKRVAGLTFTSILLSFGPALLLLSGHEVAGFISLGLYAINRLFALAWKQW